MEQWNRMLNPTLEFWCLVLEHLHIFAKYMNFSAGKICGVWKLETIFQKRQTTEGLEQTDFINANVIESESICWNKMFKIDKSSKYIEIASKA